MKYFISILLFFFSVIGFAQDFNQKLSKHDRNNNYDMIHYYLDISVDMDKKVIGGHAHLKLVPTIATDSITLDAENMKIFSISNFGKPVNFTHSERKLNLRFGQAFSQKDTLDLVIHYVCNAGNSKGVKYFSPNPDTPDYNYQMWTQGQEELNHFWFPCYDFPNDRVTSEIKVTVNEDLETVSNGKLISVTHDKENKTKTFHWLQDKQHVTYLVSLVVGKYSIVNEKSDKLPLPCYVYPGMETDAKAIFSQTKDMIRFFEKVTGTKYQWDKYSQTIL